MSEQATTRTIIHLEFNGYCLTCGRKAETIHEGDCDMNGAEERVPLLYMALEYWCQLQRRERGIDDV